MRDLRLRIRLLRIGLQGEAIRRLIRCDAFWRLARRFKPILPLSPHQIWVTRHDDVVEVLSRDRDFGVPYLPNLEGLRSPFLLGLPDGDDYERQLDVLLTALHDPRLPSIEELSISEAERALAEANGSIDVVRGLTERVLLQSVGTYLGTGPATPAQLEQSRAIFYEIFINALHNPVVTEKAVAAGAVLRAHIAQLVAERRAATQHDEAAGVDLLGLLLRDGRLDDDELVNSLLGLFVGWTTPVSRSMGFAVDVLLDRESAIRLGHEAAREGGPKAVRDVMLEALRFQPSAPALERICQRETHIAGRRVRRGDQVMALVSSAMMDETRVTDPRRFLPGRGAEANLHFGDRLHRCIGQHISMAQIAAISSVLLAHENVRRAGSLERVGPYPSRLLVSFRPARA
jgi:cytochrome P450